jgi:hypothetical protein
MVGLLSKVGGRECLVLTRRDGTEALMKDVRRIHLLETFVAKRMALDEALVRCCFLLREA